MRSRPAIAALITAGLVLVPSVGGAEPVAPVDVAATVETPPRFDGGDLGNADADDPAIWVNPADRAQSLVIGTLKDGGLDVYDLSGRLVQHIDAPPPPTPEDAPGRFNNVDLIPGVRVGHKVVDLAVVTDRGRDKLRFYAIDPKRPEPLVDVTAPDAPFVFSADQDEVNTELTAYGLATGKVGPLPVAFVTRAGRSTVAALALVVRDGKVTYRRATGWSFPTTFPVPGGGTWAPCLDEDGVEPQFEGMVFDSRTLTLYAAQEPVGVWKVRLGHRPQLVERVVEYGVPYDRIGADDEGEFECELREDEDPGVAGRFLSADAEGLTIYPLVGDGGILLASSQGDSTFHTYDLRTFEHLGAYAVADGPSGVDGVSDSDGAAVVPHALGSAFPKGLLVVHDGENEPEVVDDEGETIDQTNFKYVPWEDVAAPLGLPVRTR
jgi:3-phytase